MRAAAFPLGAAVTLAELDTDPHPVLARLREHEPVSWLPALDGWLVTRRDLVMDVMRDPDTFTVDDPRFSTGQVVGPSMLTLDGAEHKRHRDPWARPFRLDAVRERFSAPVAEEADRLIDAIAPAGAAELRRELAGPLATAAVTHALGLQEAGTAEVLGWYDAIVASVTEITAGGAPTEAGRRGFEDLRDAIEPVLARGPETSLVAAAAGDAGGLRARGGRLQRGGAAVRRDRDDGGHDRQRDRAPALEPRAARRRARRAGAARQRDRGVAAARARGCGDRPLRHARHRAGGRIDPRARARGHLDRRRQSRPLRLPRSRPLRRAPRERQAARRVRARAARLHRDAPRPAGGAYGRRAGARAPPRASSWRPGNRRRRAGSCSASPTRCACAGPRRPRSDRVARCS